MTEIKAEGLDEERAALAEAGDTDMDNLGHLRHALAVADQLAGEVARITADRESVEPLLADVRRLGDVVAEVALVNPSLRDVVACNSVCDIAERMICRLIAERDDARKVGPRWERSEAVGEMPEEWRLTIGGRLCVPDAKIVRPAGRDPLVWILGRSFGTLHEAARALCTRLGLPLITEGLPKEDADA